MRIALNALFLSLLVGGSAHAQVPADPSSYTRTSAFEYDPVTGLLTSETVEPDNLQLCVKTTYQYDVYGNKTKATTANCDGATGNAVFVSRSNSSSYAAQTAQILTGPNGTPLPGVAVAEGAFPTSSSNALGQSDAVSYDPRFGAKVSATGPNGLTTYWQVDDFGRTYKETRADRTNTLTMFCYLPDRGIDTSSNYSCPTPDAAEIPADAVSYTWSEVRNGQDIRISPASRVYMDRAGRKLRTVTTAYDGDGQAGGAARLIYQDIEYHPLGMQVLVTQPYFADTGASTSGGAANSYGMSLTTYDVLGRPLLAYVADDNGTHSGQFQGHGVRQASVTGFTYDGLNTTTLDDQGNSRLSEKNVDGKVWRITDALGAQVVNEYDPFGNLIATKDALQNVIAISYDIRGRKMSLQDPDTGLWQYDHDALGELVWQQNANQADLSKTLSQTVATTMAYDQLGRMVQRIDPREYTSNWFYDQYADLSKCNMGVGKLCETRTTSGIDKKIVYDNFGRAINTRTDISGGPSFASAVAYDSTNGWVSSQTYPTGLTINYSHTSSGFLSSLTLATAAKVNPLPAVVGGPPGISGALAAGSVLWQAKSYNAWGRLETQSYGNGVSATTSYLSDTGRVQRMTAGLAGASDVADYTYYWNGLNQLTGRDDADGDGSTGAVTDKFEYDGLGRLKKYMAASAAIPDFSRTVSIWYNALGSVLWKSDVGLYAYPAQGAAHPHQLQTIGGASPASASGYGYDYNGNMVSASGGKYTSISYNSFNMPDSQYGLQGTAGTQYFWQYDENHQRIKEMHSDGSGSRTTWMLHPDNAGGLAFESEQSGAVISNRHYLSAGGNSIGVLISNDALPVLAATQTAPAALDSVTLDKVEYWHKDQLGSLVATTDHNAAVTARYSYDPFGKRRTVSGNYDADGKLVYDWNNTSSGTDRGYTGHEHLDDVGLIHMNGRIFDPRLGIFMQGDPMVQDPTNLQNMNRYGYCYNNPMTCTDPSGYLFGGLFNIPILDNLWNNHVKSFVPVIASIVISIYAPEYLIANYGLNGFEAAAVSGFVSGTVASGNLEGGLQGAFSAGMFYGAGSVLQSDYFVNGAGKSWAVEAGIGLHGVVGCVTSVAGSGKCGAGALSAAFSKAMLPVEAGTGDKYSGAAIAAIAGGTGSVLGGGKFANGAITGAFSYLYNACLHGQCDTKLEQKMYDYWPGYKFGTGLYNSFNSGRLDFTFWEGVDGISFGLSGAARAAQVLSGSTIALYRVVLPGELADIQATGAFRTIEGVGEGKYFTTSAEHAASYAKQAVQAYRDPAYTLIETQAPKDILNGIEMVPVDRGIPAWQIPSERLPVLTPNVMNSMPIPK